MTVSVIGCGNMGGAFVQGLVSSEAFSPEEIIVSDPDEEKLRALKDTGVKTTTSNKYAAENSEIIFLAVEPEIVEEVLKPLKLPEEKLVVSLAAGVSTDLLTRFTEAKIIRVMPNICVREGEMASAYSMGPKVGKRDEQRIKNILKKLGDTVNVDEENMHAATGLSGSGPAFVFLVIQALKEGGEKLGLSEKEAGRLAAQTVKGSGEKVLKSDKSVEELVDMVCTPGGTTIEGVKILENRKIRKAFEDAVRASAEKAEKLSMER